MAQVIRIPTPEETELNKSLYPERHSDKPYPEYPDKVPKKYRIKVNGQWSGYYKNKENKTEKQLSEMVAHPKISQIEWG